MKPQEKQDIERITGIVQRIRFHSEETGFSVVSLLPKGQKDAITLCGSAAYLKEGEYLEATGQWKNDPRFGLQFKAERVEIVAPDSAEGMQRYLASGMVKGIGPHLAAVLVKAFGGDVFDVIDNEPDRLLQLPGIGKKRVEAIKEAWKEQKSVRDIMVFLQSHGIGPNRAVKIYKIYGEESIVRIKQNPYFLTEINGIGFKIADSIAMSVGIPKDSLIRARAGIKHVLSESVGQGHCYMLDDDLIKQAMELLESTLSIVDKAIIEEVESGGLVVEGGERIFLPHILKAEKSVARHIKRLNGGHAPWRGINPDVAIPLAENKIGIKLSKSQDAAVRVFCKSKATIITGGPGVGKTATLKTVLSLLLDSDLNLILCAPTGKAAKRMSEATGLEAKTIHRTLEYDGENKCFKFGLDNPLKCDLLVVDETSMVDILLMDKLLDAVPSESGVLIVGDKDQLASVGSGSVLNDLISSGIIPVVRLTEIFRQAAESRIITTAHRVNSGLMPEKADPANPKSDFYFIAREETEDIVKTIIDLVSTRVPTLGFNPIRDIQVLAPMNRGPLGVNSLNIELKKVLNPSVGPGISRFGTTFNVGDRVLQVVNNYDKGDSGVFNGDQGIVVEVNVDEGYILSDFDGQIIKHETGDLDEITLSYSITVHKSQGAAFPVVIIPLAMAHYLMLQRNLIYTGITRGEKLVIIVGQPKALSQAVRTQQSNKRQTWLRERLINEGD